MSRPVPKHRRSIEEKTDVQTRQDAVNRRLRALGIYNGDPWWMAVELLLAELPGPLDTDADTGEGSDY